MAELEGDPPGSGTGIDQLRTYFEEVLRQMPAGVLIAEAPSGRLVLANEEIESILRRPVDPSASPDAHREWVAFHPGGRRYRPEECPLARSIRTGEVVEGEEMAIERGDGSRGVIRVSSRPVRDDAGRIVAGVLTAYDITRERAQESARAFLSRCSTLLASSLDYETTLRNVARLLVPGLADWCSIDILREDGQVQRLAVEHADAEKTRLAREIAQRLPPDSMAPIGVGRVLRTGRSELIPEVGDRVLRAAARDPEHLAFLRGLGIRSAMIVPLTGQGRILGAITLLTAESGRRYGPQDLEIAEELAVRAAFALANARLYRESQAANRAKSDFLTVVSHELRTPLTAIIGYAELLALGVPDPVTPRQQEQVERIEVSARHLLLLIEEILTVVSLEGRRLRPRREQVRLEEVLQRADAIIRPMASAKELALRFDVAAPDLVLETDPDRVVQILLNLLSNAVKFTERGEVRLIVEPEGDAVRIEVHDTGIGMTPEQQQRVYDAFWQAEQPVTRRSGGTGLGLTITRRLLEVLGGSVEVESTPGSGSRFTAWLPLRLPPRADRDSAADPEG